MKRQNDGFGLIAKPGLTSWNRRRRRKGRINREICEIRETGGRHRIAGKPESRNCTGVRARRSRGDTAGVGFQISGFEI
jgi:hypothetical protein